MAELRFDNPFHDLWVTEILDPEAYVQTFSPLLVADAEELFSGGHVVLKGRQGSGKSMLLNLLETSTRIAYARSNTNYPVPVKQRAFISAGVQLTRQNASLVAARSEEIRPDQRQQIIAATFADYLNILLCLDLLKNILYLADEQARQPNIIEEVKVDLGEHCIKRLFSELFSSDAWLGFIQSNCTTLPQAVSSLEERLRAHKNYYNYNIDKLPAEIEKSRSPAGEPIAELAAALRESCILPPNTIVLLRVDQHEELFELERHSGLGNVFRQVINSALARRDPRVAYRIGTRHYAWGSDITAWGSGAPLEDMRDYSVVDLDFILKRGEHTKNWKFPAFAADVVHKRLKAAGFNWPDSAMGLLFGKSLEPAERGRRYVGKSKSLVRIDATWAPEWTRYLETLWTSGEPLEAKFGEAWLRQQSQIQRRIAQNGSVAHDTPWRASPWWVKERNEIALMHLAGDRQQALIWSGERQVVDLAGHNILAFMTTCKSIWATWQRRNPDDAENRMELPSFSVEDQVIGIAEASQIWFKKIQVGLEADQRTRLISALGRWFRQRMLDDRSLSYPGHSGFSLTEAEFALNTSIVQLIKVCRDHGDLMESAHTTKAKDQAPRIKWYLHPLLCPLFRIPHIRTKEPVYTTLADIKCLYNNQKRVGPSADEATKPQDNVQFGFPGM